ncbi:hypothetical protein BST32_01810 [Mycobacteroides abscessus subsp. massiliense]|nr:hypothetical protein BST32_01810 [Mycobacteroides abscessus subsp. massiliense]OTR00262.1 hypothetical protein B9M84_08680 [Mycobacteroides abscessus]OTR32901.1 hypothetical protein B9M78_05805 [Mycobacteroides abscessus]WJJ56450.1 hypothetical protein PROPHICCUG48898T2_38 [Mycobacterium phage CCUG48898T-2]
MTDPAIEAAQRAANEFFAPIGTVREAAMVAAAREMAKSVQELHKPEPGPLIHDDTPWTCCADCGDEWPCETAKRVYPSSELGLT